jgi:hypothetical protein
VQLLTGYVYICVLYMYVCIYAFMYVYMYVYVYLFVYIYIHTYIYIYRLVMLVAAPYVDTWMGNENSSAGDVIPPQVAVLTMFFLFLYFLMATQDIIVDGWALTMLSR